MKTAVTLLLLATALAGCASPAARGPAAQAGHDMDEMCCRHAASPAGAASAPGMMEQHCKARAAAPAGAASHVH